MPEQANENAKMVTFAIDPRKTAIVAVDLQNCNVKKSPIAAPLGLQIVDKLNRLAAHYRAAGSTIIWTPQRPAKAEAHAYPLFPKSRQIGRRLAKSA
jgi:nicotinamidase-related amidase